MTKIEIYTAPHCGACVRAKSLLDRKGLTYTEIDVAADPDRRLEMVKRSGARTVPQIFIHNRCIGGYDNLAALEAKGELDRLLAPTRDSSKTTCRCARDNEHTTQPTGRDYPKG